MKRSKRQNGKNHVRKLSRQSCNRNEEKKLSSSESSYGWVIVAASFTASFIVDGVCFSVGIFMIDFLDYFKESKAKMSWVGSVLNGMYLSVGPLAGALTNRFGCRSVAIVGSFISASSFIAAAYSPSVEVLILTFGALGSFGFGLLYLPAIVMVGYYFDKHRALATGIAVCGSGIGAFVFAPLCHFLLEQYSWKGASWIIGGITLHGIVIGAFFRPLNGKYKSQDRSECNGQHLSNNQNKPTGMVQSTSQIMDNTLRESISHINMLPCKRQENNIECSENFDKAESKKVFDNADTNVSEESRMTIISKHFTGIRLLKNPVFVIYGISCFLCMLGFYIPFIFLPDHAIQKGLSGKQGAFLISIIGIANTITRVLCGFISDFKWVDCLLFNNVALVVAGTATVLCPFCDNFESLTIYCVTFGFGIAVFVSLRSIIVVELLGLDQLTNAFGLVTMFQGLSAFIGAPIAGSLYDRTNNYNYSFYMAGGALTLAGLINLPLRRIDAYIKRKRSNELKSISTRDVICKQIVNADMFSKI